MGLKKVAQVNVLVEGSGETVTWEKVYCSDVEVIGFDITSYTIDTITYYWRLAGDGQTDDPGTAVTIECIEGIESPTDPGYYHYCGNIVTSYTYALYVGVVPVAQDRLTGIMLSSMDIISHIDASSGVHGVTGDVVGDSDAQILSAKTITDPIINAIKNGLFKITIPTLIDDEIMAVISNLTSKEELVEELSSGSDASISVLKYILGQLLNSEKFASMLTYAGNYSTMDGTPDGVLKPTKILQFCMDSSPTPPDVYVSVGDTKDDWEKITA